MTRGVLDASALGKKAEICGLILMRPVRMIFSDDRDLLAQSIMKQPDTLIKPTLEVRWFSQLRPFDPSDVYADAIQPECRTDWYAPLAGNRTGVKLREGRLEAKLQLESLGERQLGPVRGQLERWTKWSGLVTETQGPTDSLLDDSGWIAVSKRRFMQTFELEGTKLRMVPERSVDGCDFELTEIQVRGQTWWTVGFEATGSEASIFQNLEGTVDACLTGAGIECTEQLGMSCGYPQWLARHS